MYGLCAEGCCSSLVSISEVDLCSGIVVVAAFGEEYLESVYFARSFEGHTKNMWI